MHMRCAAIIKILNSFIFFLFSQMKSMPLFKTNPLIMFSRFLNKNLSVIFFHFYVDLEMRGIHVLRVVPRKKACLGLGFFSL